MLHCTCGYTCGVQVAFDRHIKKFAETAPGEHELDPDAKDDGCPLISKSKSTPNLDRRKTVGARSPVIQTPPDDEDILPPVRACSSPSELLSPKTPSSPSKPLPPVKPSRATVSFACVEPDASLNKAPLASGGHIQLLIIRHAQSANKDRTSGQAASTDPDLSDMGFEQAESLGKRLSQDYGSKSSSQVMVVSSPMRRCLYTILPAVKLLNLADGRCLCHGSFFEYGCAGKRFVSSTATEINKEFPYFKPVGFTSEGNWDYRGENPKENESDCRARAERMKAFLQEQAEVLLKEAAGSVPTLILCIHQTMNDLLCQLLIEGSSGRWEYGDIKYKLSNTAITELFFQPSGQATFGTRNDDKHVISRQYRRRATTIN